MRGAWLSALVCVLGLWPSLEVAAQQRFTFVDRGETHTVEVAQDGELLVHTANASFRARLGTDRVLVVSSGALDVSQLDVAIDEVLSERAHIVAVRSTRGESAFVLAERLAPLVRSGALRSAMPDLALEHVRADIRIPPDDPRYGGQWFFGTIHLESAWAREDGDPSVTVAVIDDGCDLTHPDLAPHLLPGYDAFSDDSDPSYLPMSAGNNHGTSCAGLVAAVTDNGTDVAGACPECSMRCIRLLGAMGSLIPISSDVRAFDFAMTSPDVAVVSNSWGFVDGAPAPGPLADIIQRIQVEGRGGLGAVVVFAAGNDASVIGPDELQAIPGVVTVGAINPFDEAASFSNSGACVSMVAPTGTLTTDIVGADGDDPGDVTARFGGTSSACPIVAGVFGLLASADPTLDAAMLRAALVETVRPAPFATPDADGHDPLYGFGIVDPRAALDRILPPLPDAGVDEDAALDDAGVDAGTLVPTGGGCGCRAGGGTSSPLTLALALALVLTVRSRRRALAVAVALALGCASPPSDVRPTVQELRPDTTGSTELPPRYDSTEIVESIVSPGGAFRIHFTRLGRNAVASTDADADGTPDYVSLVAATYDEVLAFDVGQGFRPPVADGAVPVDNGGDDLFDVYLVDFAGSSDGSFRRELCTDGAGCTGYMLQENDFAGYHYPSTRYAVRLLASHEFFHAVQAAYDDLLGTQGSTLAESTAVWASERFDPSLQDIEGFSSAFTTRTDRALAVDPIGAAQPYAYGASILWEFMTTTFDDALVRKLWEDLDTATADQTWVTVLDALLVREYASSFAEAFPDFAEWLVFTGSRADSAHGPTRGDEFAEVAAVDVGLPYSDTSVRLFPGAIRYFAVPSSTLAVRLTGDGASEIDVIAVALTGTRFVSDVRGRGEATLSIPLAENAIIALVDTRLDGMSRVVSLCVAATDAECAPAVDAGADDAASPDAGALGDAGVVAPPPASCGCRAGTSGSAGSLGLVGASALLLARRKRRRTIAVAARASVA
jgi:serine protease